VPGSAVPFSQQHERHVGTLCAAGSGKTSLVNALAGRLTGGELQGSILVNGRDRRKNFQNISA
jgi:ABC-type multidrug transport system ATPase subunit